MASIEKTGSFLNYPEAARVSCGDARNEWQTMWTFFFFRDMAIHAFDSRKNEDYVWFVEFYVSFNANNVYVHSLKCIRVYVKG